ncbi:membrane integrity-associated transporter subunit PqiC [Paraburkholderia bengalensis]|uniref:Membrane integrity-associated transporter subunit PqiC n=1 Tax=Paraburkholderia bengalensis TaxID=2747562 RepID=A0ABU8IU48_9BURK
MKRVCWFLAAISLSLLTGACVDTRSAGVYSLNSERSHLNELDAGVPLAIVVDYVTVPEEVDRPQLVVRINPSQLRIVEAARWSEPLKTQIGNVLAADLARLFRDARVSDTSQTTDRPTLRLAINVRTFEAAPGKGAVIAIVWSILTPDSTHVLNGKSIVLQRVDGDGYGALVDAQSRALAAVTVDMADAIMAAIRKKPDTGIKNADASAQEPQAPRASVTERQSLSRRAAYSFPE